MSTSTEEFATPATASGIRWEDLNGSLLLIEVDSLETGVTTKFGPADAIRANVTVLDGDRTGEEFNDTLVFPKVLVSQLRPNVGKKVLGRLGQGQAKSSQSPPWMLHDATDADKAIARAHVANNAKPPF